MCSVGGLPERDEAMTLVALSPDRTKNTCDCEILRELAVSMGSWWWGMPCLNFRHYALVRERKLY